MRYTTANTRYDDLKKLIDAGKLLIGSAATDHAGAVQASAVALKADANVSVATAYVNNTNLVPSARYTKQVTQLFMSLLNRRPDVTELMYWVNRLTLGDSAGSASKGIMDSTDARDVGRQTNRDDTAFVSQLYQFGLGRAADPAGLDFWRGHFGGGISRADLAVQWIDSFNRSANSDTVLLTNKTTATLQAVVNEAALISASPDMSPVIRLADDQAVATAAAYDASAALAASSAAARNTTTGTGSTFGHGLSR